MRCTPRCRARSARGRQSGLGIPPTSPGLLLDCVVVAGRDEPVAETPRVRLRRLRRDDLDEVAAMGADPEQMRFFPRPKTRAEVRAWLAWNVALYEERGFGTWYLESRSDRAFLGYCGLRPLLLDGRDEVELAWHVEKAHWNRGIATEAARASIDLGFTTFGLAELVAIVHPDNGASRRVARKLGMAEERTLVHAGEPVVVHRTGRT